jgi:hypothetical protein
MYEYIKKYFVKTMTGKGKKLYPQREQEFGGSRRVNF